MTDFPPEPAPGTASDPIDPASDSGLDSGPESETGDDALVERHARALGATLHKLEGRVVVRIAGLAETAGLRVAYDLVPSQGVLAKPSKWRKLDPSQKMTLV